MTHQVGHSHRRLLTPEELVAYEDLDQALFDMKDEKKLDYSVVFEEIFGDG